MMRALLCLASALLLLFLPSVLGRPTDLTTTIDGDKLILSWQYTQSESNPVYRFFITVQEDKYHLPPDYISVDAKERQAALVGMNVNANYMLRVVAHLKSHAQEHSDYLRLTTTGLAVLKVRNIKVSSITAKTALIRWEYDSQYIVHSYKFRIYCTGAREYTNRDNTLVKEPSMFRHIAQTGLQGVGMFYVDYLPPNTRFECDFTTFKWWASRMDNPTKIPAFTTSYVAPTPPPTPTISVPQERSELNRTMFTINLFRTDNRFGPISHYKVFGVPVQQTEDGTATKPLTLKVDANSLVSTAVSADLATEGTEAVPFLIGTYTTLPDDLAIDGHRTGYAFKPLTHYAAVVAAFTKAQEGNTEMFSFSAPSDPPVYIDESMHFEEQVKFNTTEGGVPFDEEVRKSEQALIMNTLSSSSSSSCRAYCTMCLLLVK